MPASPLEALQNAQLLKQNRSFTNTDNLGDAFATMYADADTADPLRRQQMLGRAEDFASEFGAGPGVRALRDVADARRISGLEDQAAHDLDVQAHGMDRAMVAANISNAQGDVLSEGAAHRAFRPWASRLHEREMEDKTGLADLQYGVPSRIRAQADVLSAQQKAEGDVAAARARVAPLSPADALRDALLKRFQAGYPVTPEDEAQLRALIIK